MADLQDLDRAFAAIMARIVNEGRAPHFVELARELDVPLGDGRELLNELMAAGVPGWVHPGTDYIASFPPFNLQPTQYRITVDGQPGWFAQCGFEALAVRWVFPGRRVRIDAPCLDCGEPVAVEMRDEEPVRYEPETLVGYTRSAVGGSPEDRPFR